MIGSTTNRNGDSSTVSRGTACFAARAGSSTRDGQIRLSELVLSSSSLSICSTSTSRDIVIANRGVLCDRTPIDDRHYHDGFLQILELQIARRRSFSLDSSTMAG